MHSMSVQELKDVVQILRSFLGHRLQEVVVAEGGVGLGFWSTESGLAWTWFESHPWFPILLPLNRCPEREVKPLRPLALFLRSHFLDHHLEKVELVEDKGRVVKMVFSNRPVASELEFYVWPGTANVKATCSKKHVWFKKQQQEVPFLAKNEDRERRDVSQLLEDWMQLRHQSQKQKRSTLNIGESHQSGVQQTADLSDFEKQKEKEIKKFKLIIEKVKREIENKENQGWRIAGEYLVAHQTLAVPLELEPFLDKKKSLSWNIERCFTQSKENDRKKKVTQERLDFLNQKFQALLDSQSSEQLTNWKSNGKKEQSRSNQRRQKSEARFRTVKLDHDWVVKIGKSGVDNIQLLREAKSWDFWMHLRGFPGSHAIISRPKNKPIPDPIFIECGFALVEQCFPRNSKQLLGDDFELIIAECKFVKPVKGEKPGKVTYSHDRTLRFKFGNRS